MKKCLFLVLVLFLFLTNLVFSSSVKVGDMPDLLKPDAIQFDGDDLFVVENSTCSIHVYSVKNLKLKFKSGKKGEGPGAFKVRPTIRKITPDYIVAKL